MYRQGIFYCYFVNVDDVLYYQLVFLSIPCHLIEFFVAHCLLIVYKMRSCKSAVLMLV